MIVTDDHVHMYVLCVCSHYSLIDILLLHEFSIKSSSPFSGSAGFNKIAMDAQEIRKRNFSFRDYYK